METETLAARCKRLAPLIESTRFALTEADVIYDYHSGEHRYALRTKRQQRDPVRGALARSFS